MITPLFPSYTNKLFTQARKALRKAVTTVNGMVKGNFLDTTTFWQKVRILVRICYGQAQVESGVVIDTNTFNKIHDLNAERVIVEVGVLWRSLLQATLPQKLTPPVLTDYLELSIGGTYWGMMIAISKLCISIDEQVKKDDYYLVVNVLDFIFMLIDLDFIDKCDMKVLTKLKTAIKPKSEL